MSLSVEAVLHFSIRKGALLDAQLLAHIAAFEQQHEAREQALRFLRLRDHSSAELARKLRQKGIDAALIAPLLEELTQKGYLNEARVAQALLERLQARGYGPMRIKAEMQKRGTPRELLDRLLQSAPPPDAAKIEALLASKRRGSLREPKERARLLAMLAIKGFSYHDCMPVLEALADEDEEEAYD